MMDTSKHDNCACEASAPRLVRQQALSPVEAEQYLQTIREKTVSGTGPELNSLEFLKEGSGTGWGPLVEGSGEGDLGETQDGKIQQDGPEGLHNPGERGSGDSSWYEFEQEGVTVKVGWVSHICELFQFGDPTADPLPEIPTLHLYLTALYYCMTILTTVGFGNEAANTNAEKVFTCVAMIVCSLMHAVVFGNVTAIIQRMYARRFSYDIQANELRDFYRIYGIPKPLKRKIENFYQSFWTVNRGIKHEQLIHDFPEDLKGDVSLHIFSEFLNHPVFDGAPKSCLKAIALKMKHSFINPNETLLQKGDIVSNMYYIRNGCIEIRQDDSIVGVAGKDEILGLDFTQSSLFGKSSAAVRATLHCDLHIIPTNALIDALSLYPEFAIAFSQRLPRELAFDLSSPEEMEIPGSPVSYTGSNLVRASSAEELYSSSPYGSSVSLPPILQMSADPSLQFLGVPERDPITSKAMRSVNNIRMAEVQVAVGKMRQNLDLITQHLLLINRRNSQDEKPSRYLRNKNA